MQLERENSPDMILLYGFIVLLLLIVSFLLFAPLRLCLNSRQQRYQISWAPLAVAQVIPAEDDLWIRVRILFWQRQWLLTRLMLLAESRGKERPKQKKAPAPKPEKKAKTSFSWKTIKRLLASFRIHRFRIDLDTGDYLVNSWLFPLLYFIQTPRYGIRINYLGRTDIDLEIENSGFRLLRAFFGR